MTKAETIASVLLVEIDGPVATLTMNRPAKRNAMCDELLDAIDEFFSDPPEGVRVVILTGTRHGLPDGQPVDDLADSACVLSNNHGAGFRTAARTTGDVVRDHRPRGG